MQFMLVKFPKSGLMLNSEIYNRANEVAILLVVKVVLIAGLTLKPRACALRAVIIAGFALPVGGIPVIP